MPTFDEEALWEPGGSVHKGPPPTSTMKAKRDLSPAIRAMPSQRDLFDEIDTNHDGVISKEEFIAAMTKQDLDFPETEGFPESLHAELQRLRQQNQELKQDTESLQRELKSRRQEVNELM